MLGQSKKKDRRERRGDCEGLAFLPLAAQSLSVGKQKSKNRKRRGQGVLWRQRHIRGKVRKAERKSEKGMGQGQTARKHASDVVVEADKAGGWKKREGCVVR